MPPIASLLKDDKMYKKKEDNVKSSIDFKSNIPPNPTTPTIRYRTKEAQKIARDSTTRSINDPNPAPVENKEAIVDYEMEKLQGENNVQDYIKNPTKDDGKPASFTDRMVKFVDDPLGYKDMDPAVLKSDTEMRLDIEKRNTGQSIKFGKPALDEVAEEIVAKPVSAAAEGIGNVVQEGVDFLKGSATQLLIGIVGVYLLGQFLQGVGEGNTRRRGNQKKN